MGKPGILEVVAYGSLSGVTMSIIIISKSGKKVHLWGIWLERRIWYHLGRPARNLLDAKHQHQHYIAFQGEMGFYA